MKLITKAIEKQLLATPLYTYESKRDQGGKPQTPNDQIPILVKFFCPWNQWTWYVTEAERRENGDWLFFGFVEGFEKELGYFVLSELTSVTGPGGLKIERDLHYDGHNLGEVLQ